MALRTVSVGVHGERYLVPPHPRYPAIGELTARLERITGHVLPKLPRKPSTRRPASMRAHWAWVHYQEGVAVCKAQSARVAARVDPPQPDIELPATCRQIRKRPRPFAKPGIPRGLKMAWRAARRPVGAMLRWRLQRRRWTLPLWGADALLPVTAEDIEPPM